MADTTFSDGTIVTTAWLNEVNHSVFSPIYALLDNVPTEFSSLDAAVTAIGSTRCTVVVRDDITMAANATFPSTATLRIENLSQITTTGYTLTINGKFECGLWQCFSGTGSVVFARDAVEYINPRWWGMDPAASAATNDAALTAAKVAAAAMGNGTEIRIPEGNYAMVAGTNFASAGVAYVGIGMPTLDYSAGTGIGFKLDAGGSGLGIQRMRVENIDVKGGANITHAFYTRGIWRSIFKNCRAREATTAGFAVLFNVLNTWDHCYISDDVSSQTTRPTAYWLLDDDGTPGNRSQANTFINCEASGHGSGSTKSGWVLEDSTLNVWEGGTGESLSIGIEIKDDQCRNNTFIGMDLEDNQTNDAVVKGFANAFYTSSANSATTGNTIDITTAKNTLFVGGYMRLVTLGASSSNTTFIGTHFEDNASLGIQGSGTYRAYGITEGNGFSTSVVQTDVLGPSATWTPTVAQSASITGLTIAKNNYRINGRTVHVRAKITMGSAGTAGNVVEVLSIPAAIAILAADAEIPIGRFVFFDASASTYYEGSVIANSTSSILLQTNNASSAFGVAPAVTIASGDILWLDMNYEIA